MHILLGSWKFYQQKALRWRTEWRGGLKAAEET